jgi:hypothetical protein
MRLSKTSAFSREVSEMLLSEVLATVDTPEGRARLKAYLASQPFPHFEAYPENPKLLVRIDEDGMRTVGRFIKRQFVPYKIEAPDASGSISTE